MRNELGARRFVSGWVGNGPGSQGTGMREGGWEKKRSFRMRRPRLGLNAAPQLSVELVWAPGRGGGSVTNGKGGAIDRETAPQKQFRGFLGIWAAFRLPGWESRGLMKL
jgi:hypothetical protein